MVHLKEPLADGAASARIPNVHAGAGLHLLLRAYEYAHILEMDSWQFALEIDELRRAGLTNSEFRWLVAKGYVEQAQEVTRPGDHHRRFRRVSRFTLLPESCFVVTESGVRVARQSVGEADRVTLEMPHRREAASCGDVSPTHRRSVSYNGHSRMIKPTWIERRRELRLGQLLVKVFRWPANNQEAVLAVFEEEGWPVRIDDPLPRTGEHDPKQRLHDTIKCLNRSQTNSLIHFRGDGTGQGVLWDLRTHQGEHGLLQSGA